MAAVLHPYKIINAGDMSQATLTSSVVDIRTLNALALELMWTGTPAGGFDIQGSLDYMAPGRGSAPNAGTWVSIGVVNPPTAAGSSGNAVLDLTPISYPYIRVVYTRSSGSGTLNVMASGKGD